MNNNFTVESHQERRQRRAVIASALDIIPDDMDFNDGCIMLNILYPIWKYGKNLYHGTEQIWKDESQY
jgi:hypothetical protein